jgi:hypothetical protein
MALQHPHPHIINPSTRTTETEIAACAKENLADRLHYVMLKEATIQAALTQLEQNSETTLLQEISCHKIAYKHRFIAQGKGYQLTKQRQNTIEQQLQKALVELNPKSQKAERQWVFSLSEGVLFSKSPEQLVENLLMKKLQQTNPTFTKLSKELFELAQWLQRQTVAYQHTWEGQRLAVIIDLLQFKQA